MPQNAGFVWFDVNEVTPARERPFDEVKDQVLARWTEDETNKAVEAKAKELLAAAETAKSLVDVATGAGLELKTVDNVQRGRSSDDLSPAVIARAFDVPDGGFGIATGGTPSERVLFQVTKVTIPAETSSDVQAAAQLGQALENDLLQQYVVQLRKEVGVSINERSFQLAVGGGEIN
ncbi:MAG: hypothetical protein B7Z15_08905 [Rhizobiales bacterium 32-66-8]|nr:MAG: hypothetical protein B7Z15_08905 [Rhizobiales bacterium 32-66-8]